MANQNNYDVIIAGAGFSGLYMLHLLQENNYSVKLYEAGGNVGGTWYWNAYPGSGCDIPSMNYCYTFSQEIYEKWTWSKKYASQSEILDYINFVADELDLRKNIQFNTKVKSAHFCEEAGNWLIETDQGEKDNAKYFISAFGPLGTVPNIPNIPGMENFKGEIYHSGQWPTEGVDLKNKRVGIMGTGSSGAQLVPVVAELAKHVTVLQRRPHWIFPKNNYRLEQSEIAELKKSVKKVRELSDKSPVAFPVEFEGKPYSAFEDSAEERHKYYEKLWEMGDWAITLAYEDSLTNPDANEDLAKFIRGKIREIVKDPKTAEKLLPYDLVGGRRRVLVENYYETFNKENVSLVSVKDNPIVEFTSKGVRTTADEHELDVIILATGFDSITGDLLNISIKGKRGKTLREKWNDLKDFKTYLALSHSEFPNFFSLYGPHGSVRFNAVRGIELHVEWTFDFIEYLEKNGIKTAEPKVEAENEWTNFVNEIGEESIRTKVDSWYLGTNIEGKQRTHLTYHGDFLSYKEKFDNCQAQKYTNFHLNKSTDMQS